MSTDATLILTRRDVADLLGLDECIVAVEEGFRAHANGTTLPAGVLGVPSGAGGFHVKTAGLQRSRMYFAAKCNANFPDNPATSGLPSIQGVVALYDGINGMVLALMDSIEITAQRTAAATAVAARHLARPDSAVAAICGCGLQGRTQLRALTRVLPLTECRAFDRDDRRARDFASEMSAELKLRVTVATDAAAAVHGADVCVTCTPSRRAFLDRGHVSGGAFLAAVGADNPEKQELTPELMAASTVVVDVLEQCATIGDLHHALDAGTMSREQVHAELHEVVAGKRPGRRSPEEIVIFDSTGTALEDVAAAAVVYEKAVATGAGLRVHLGG